jgi:hypothetical protein
MFCYKSVSKIKTGSFNFKLKREAVVENDVAKVLTFQLVRGKLNQGRMKWTCDSNGENKKHIQNFDAKAY